eukprot:CAMPEP_0197656672 /NCGR_PEP_ID=MMETSP1338-20131121/42836_1 /TAXON_ID=43686 ORGANISM="Pelagodinium beii, Strain RCC1491" /NCGR_SAMPLE_ID=MMETSP1338 /ASSEMBLY_ACC=CAM_ASM_000754 /LENGTH=275 /DNA_ID=CAMNT_0043232779 /DNA_START=53 /DNA_END=880 /DNA_ORIENTATION=-
MRGRLALRLLNLRWQGAVRPSFRGLATAPRLSLLQGRRSFAAEAKSAEDAARAESAKAEEAAKEASEKAEETAKEEAAEAEKKVSEEVKDEAKEAPEEAPEEAEAEEAPEKKLEKELADLQVKVKAKKHELLMSLADFENNKKRFSKEREDRRKRTTINFSTRMVEVFSKFDAFASPAPQGACQGLHEGVAMVRDIYRSTLEKFGASQLEVEIGSPFVAARHENVGSVDSSDLPESSVAELVKPGWILDPDSPKPVVVTKAEVKVAKLPEAPAPE